MLSGLRAVFPGRERKLTLLLLYAFLAFPVAGVPLQRPSAGDPEPETQNPFTGDPEAINLGRSYFRKGCSPCHGIDARGGGSGPDLTSGRMTHGDSDAALFRTIGRGVPGTEMPPSRFKGEENWMIIAFLRSLGKDSRAPVTGDREAGEQIFFVGKKCSLCHMINGKGGRLGSDLSRIGASRSPRHLMASIRDPSKEISRGFQTVTVVTNDGRRITGVRKNEDTFSVQLMARDEQLHLFLKKDLREVIHGRESLMPVYGEGTLNEIDLQDLTAYLDSLRGQ